MHSMEEETDKTVQSRLLLDLKLIDICPAGYDAGRPSRRIRLEVSLGNQRGTVRRPATLWFLHHHLAIDDDRRRRKI